MEDNEIVQKIIEKDPKAIEDLINKYGKLIFGVINKILNSSNERWEIEECFNDILMTLWKNMHLYKSERGKLINFIISVAKFKAIDYKRKIQKKNNVIELKEEVLRKDEAQESFDINDEEGFYTLIKELKEKDKEIFIRRYLFDESMEKISKDLNLSKEYIYNKLSRGRKKIKERLEGV